VAFSYPHKRRKKIIKKICDEGLIVLESDYFPKRKTLHNGRANLMNF